jgi:hypothetical protein
MDQPRLQMQKIKAMKIHQRKMMMSYRFVMIKIQFLSPFNHNLGAILELQLLAKMIIIEMILVSKISTPLSNGKNRTK